MLVDEPRSKSSLKASTKFWAAPDTDKADNPSCKYLRGRGVSCDELAAKPPAAESSAFADEISRRRRPTFPALAGRAATLVAGKKLRDPSSTCRLIKHKNAGQVLAPRFWCSIFNAPKLFAAHLAYHELPAARQSSRWLHSFPSHELARRFRAASTPLYQSRPPPKHPTNANE